MQNHLFKNLIITALKEDAAFNDITAKAFIARNSKSKTYIINKEPCVLCGIGIAKEVFKVLDKNIKFRAKYNDGAIIKKNSKVAEISGNTQKILAGERVVLNFIMHLSGIATLTKKFVDTVKPCPVKIMDTRKTTPGLRILEKYAVRCGGGTNHRMNLEDQILIKDTHLKCCRDVAMQRLYKRIIQKIKNKVPIEIEVQSLKEFKDFIQLQPDIILLDNMSLKEIKEAVKIRNLASRHIELEASGGINLTNIKAIAKTGVDRISIGSLTHSAPAVDFALDF